MAENGKNVFHPAKTRIKRFSHEQTQVKKFFGFVGRALAIATAVLHINAVPTNAPTGNETPETPGFPRKRMVRPHAKTEVKTFIEKIFCRLARQE
jgi:hypothetical protein